MKFSENEKKIEIPGFYITGNIIKWENTMIQLGNVSYITTGKLSPKPFPWLAVGIMLVSLALFGVNALVGFALLVVGAAWLYLWNWENDNRKKHIILSIVMNSGNILQILFSDREFLNNVKKVLEKILIDGGTGTQNIAVNITDCKISGNATVLNDLHIL